MSLNGEPLGAELHCIYTTVHKGCTRLSMRLRTVQSYVSDIIVELRLCIVCLSEGRGQNNQQPTPNDNKSEWWSSSVVLVYDLHRGMCCKPSGKVHVTTMSNSGPYPVTPVASQLYSSTPVAHHLLQSRSRRYTSVKYDPLSSPYSVLTTPHRLPCLDVSSPCTCYIHHLVSFSLDLVYFTWT